MRATIATAVISGLMTLWGGSASAALMYDYSGSAVTIPDNDASGRAFIFSISDAATSISSLTVSVDIGGGHNGDLYVYLSHDAGFVVLLNRVGVGVTTAGSSASGYANTGFTLTFEASAFANVHFYQNDSPVYNGSGQLTGTWQPDGRGPPVDPESPASEFDASGTATFSTFAGVNPNGDWTLFVSDVSSGGISTLNDFTVSIAAVPEPINIALAIFAGAFVVGSIRSSRWLARALLGVRIPKRD